MSAPAQTRRSKTSPTTGPFTTLTSTCVVLPAENVDTDQIIPARFLKTVERRGLGAHLFADWRLDEQGRARPDFPLNSPEASNASILVAGHNFGCGSSREHAPWALLDFGFCAVISTGFADIFRNNSLKNGLLPITLSRDAYATLLELLAATPRAEVTIDLVSQTVAFPHPPSLFSHPPFLTAARRLIARISDRSVRPTLFAEWRRRARVSDRRRRRDSRLRVGTPHPHLHALVALLPGDGIGPEVVSEGARIIRAVAERWDHTIEMREGLIGGCALDACGTPLPPQTLELCRSADAVLLGAVGGPRWDNPDVKQRPEQGLLGLRKALEVYANLRPVRVHPSLAAASPLRAERLQDVDFVFVRELTGGLYFGDKRREKVDGGERAVDVCTYSTAEIERVTRVAADLARKRRRKLTSVDKANVLETSRLWRSTVTRVAREEFPDVSLDHLLVDACAMQLLRDPRAFDVIVTENMFGDILSDEASMLAGSLGVLPSASIGDEGGNGKREAGSGRRGLYEPIHGSAPDIAGRGIANPIGTILSVAMMLRLSFGLEQEALGVERAVNETIERGCVTADIALRGGRAYSTAEVGGEIERAIADR